VNKGDEFSKKENCTTSHAEYTCPEFDTVVIASNVIG
jgi:hypothetical protein